MFLLPCVDRSLCSSKNNENRWQKAAPEERKVEENAMATCCNGNYRWNQMPELLYFRSNAFRWPKSLGWSGNVSASKRSTARTFSVPLCYFIEVKNIKATPAKQDLGLDSPCVYFRQACSFVFFLPWESQAYGQENCLQLLTDINILCLPARRNILHKW